MHMKATMLRSACVQAVADCCRAAALHPGFAKAYSRLATLLAELGRHAEAATALEAAIAAKGVRFARWRRGQPSPAVHYCGQYPQRLGTPA
jgi:hypothetical protein